MNVVNLGMGVFRVYGTTHRDPRGSLTEVFRKDILQTVHGPTFTWVQSNLSVNNRGVFRGIHFSTAPQGQAKYVTCISGSLHDFAVDLRLKSPTFGKAVTIPMLPGDSAYVPEGFGHGFVTVADNTVVSYLMTSHHDPDREHTVSPKGLVDPLGLLHRHGWGQDLLMSVRDSQAPVLADYVADDGPLPDYRGNL